MLRLGGFEPLPKLEARINRKRGVGQFSTYVGGLDLPVTKLLFSRPRLARTQLFVRTCGRLVGAAATGHSANVKR